MENIFFTSDTHFGHRHIIEFCHRPFDNVEEMNETLIKNWNEVVKPNDTVYHLGDFALGGSKVWNGILERLNGKKHLIMGNHDFKNYRESYSKYFESVSMAKYFYIDDTAIYLTHCPYLCYGGDERGVWNLYGHVHTGPGIVGKDTELLKYLGKWTYDVGVDNNDYHPISYEEVKQKISEKL